jgi:hypothetical protein
MSRTENISTEKHERSTKDYCRLRYEGVWHRDRKSRPRKRDRGISSLSEGASAMFIPFG